MVTITAYLDGEIIIDRKLSALDDRMADMRPAYPEITRIFREIVRKAFESEGASGDTGAWAPLRPRTVRERVSQGFGGEHPILERTGTLSRSLTGVTPDTISAETETYYAIGSGVPYVAYHQSTRPRTKLPRRPVVALTADQKSRLFLPIRRHVTGRDPNAPTRGRIE